MTALILVVGFISLEVICHAQSVITHSPSDKNSLERFLREYLRAPQESDDITTRYFAAFVDLNDDSKQEVVVYITGNSWCGSGGCITLVLVPKPSSFTVITKMTVTRPPIRVLTTKSKGWHDIAVRVQGGGIIDGYMTELKFNGRKYPSNPTAPPAKRIAGETIGRDAVPSDPEMISLYK